MNGSQFLIIAIFFSSLILASGCTGRDGTALPAAQNPARMTLESLVLTQSEVPENFTLFESRVKNSTEVSKIARDLGWEQGYVRRFTRLINGENQPTEILQTITRYPARNNAGIAELIEQQERAGSNMTFSNLSSPALGSYSRAFSGTANTFVVPESDGGNPLDSSSVGRTVQQDFIEIIFTKGDILEVFRMTGPESDYSTLASLAQKAYNKIP
ncbi:MAG: hypothetical protein M0Q91_07925 [Methanoregula sp.]|jgi:hypothetical protein|nr:hypothetical protein [Methanoregula sp.]